jgi:hypothetical protein
VLRLYSSPAEVLAGFDVDAPCCAYDGNRVWASLRAIISMMRQSNTAVDVTRRSPSYEVRLAKYSSRGFEIYIAELKRSQIDPTVCQVYLFQVAVCLCSHPSSMSVTLAASKVSHASLPLRNLPLLNPATSIYNGAAPYVVGLHQVVVSCHVIDGGRRYKGDLKAEKQM